MSRDVANSEEYDTEEEAMKALNDHRTFYRSIGYVIWWAYLTSPDGNKQLIEQNSNYR